MLADRETPFSVYSLDFVSPNSGGCRHDMSRQIEDIMIPFKAERYSAKTETGCTVVCDLPMADERVLTLSANATEYPQALPEDVGER